MILGRHIRFGSMCELVNDCLSDGLNTFQFFNRNNRNCRQREIFNYEIEMFNTTLLRGLDYPTFTIHAAYAMNPCSYDMDKCERAKQVIADDMKFLYRLAGIKNYVLHPGSSGDHSRNIHGLDNLIQILHELAPIYHGTNVAVETMAGSGTQMMCTYDQIDYLLSSCSDISNVSLCFDTCHVFAAGMNLVEAYTRYKDRVSVIHLNGSEAGRGSFVDRHASIRRSCISNSELAEFIQLIPSNVPVILETPSSVVLEDIKWLKENFN